MNMLAALLGWLGRELRWPMAKAGVLSKLASGEVSCTKGGTPRLLQSPPPHPGVCLEHEERGALPNWLLPGIGRKTALL